MNTEPVIPDDIKGSPLTTVTSYDPRVKAKALEKYLVTDLTITDISIDLQVPEKVIATWAKKDKWAERRQALEDEFMLRADNSYRRFIAEKRTGVAQRHERIAGEIEEAIETKIKEHKQDGSLNEVSIKRLSEALSSVTGVSARAVGIGQPSNNLAKDKEEAARSNKQPLVMIGISGTLPPDTSIKVAKEEYIDVQTEADDS